MQRARNSNGASRLVLYDPPQLQVTFNEPNAALREAIGMSNPLPISLQIVQTARVEAFLAPNDRVVSQESRPKGIGRWRTFRLMPAPGSLSCISWTVP
jgi:hypothetical protein